MLKRLLKDSSLYSVSSLLSRGVAIVLVPIYTRFFEPNEYGALDLLTVVATLANYIIALEISQGVARSYADAETESSKRQCVSTALWFACIAYGIFLLLAMPYTSSIAVFLLDSSSWSEAVRAMIMAIAANGMFFILQDLLRWQLQPFRHAVASLVYTIVSSAVGVGLVIGFNAGVTGILYGQCVGAIVGFCVTWFNDAAKHWRLTFHWESLKEMVSYSAPQVLTSIAAYFSLYVDRLLIKELMTLDDVGVYGIGARFGSVVMLVMVGFQSAMVPLVFKNYTEPEMPAQISRVFSYFLVCAISIILLLAGFSKDLVWLLTTPQYYAAWQVIPLIATSIILANMYIFTLGLHLERRTMLIAVINILVALFNIAGNILLIPIFGLTGAATATLISVWIAFLLYVYFNQKYYPVPFVWKRIVGGTAAGLAFAILLTGIQISTWTGIVALGGKFVILALGIAAVVFTGLGWFEVQSLMKRFFKKYTEAGISNNRLYKSF